MDVALYTIGVPIIFLATCKLFLVLTMRWDRSPTCLVGKTAIVTGANTGIGFHIAQDFAKRGARVILACRNSKRAEEARAKIIKNTKNSNVVVKLVDLSSLKSVREFAKNINETEERLDILVNNAAVPAYASVMTEDNLSLLMQVNIYSPFLLTLLLINLMKKSSPSRIVNVSSLDAHHTILYLDHIRAPVRGVFEDIINYPNSKLCNILFSNELARRLKGSGVSSNAAHPGPVATDIFAQVSGILGRILQIASKLIYRAPQEGAQTPIYTAVSKNVDGVSGRFFGDCAEGYMPFQARNEELAKELWKLNEEVVKLAPKEKLL